MNEIDKRNEQAVEKALGDMKKLPQAPKIQERSFAPPEHRGIHEILEEAEATMELVLAQLKIARRRMSEFDAMQARFYNGAKP